MRYSLSGLYTQNLKYEEAQAIAAKLPAEQRATVFQKAAAALPACYSQGFRDCIRDTNSSFPGCDTIQEGWVVNWDGMDKLIEDMPYCPEPIKVPYLVAGAVAAFVVGVGVAMVIR